MHLHKYSQIFLFVLSLVVVAFGQPYWSSTLAFFASFLGFALFFRFLLSLETPKKRFYASFFWFTGVQLIQLSWFLSHPYLYIIAVLLLISLFFGLQFGFIGLLVKQETINRFSSILLITSCWTLLEWSRLYILSGFAFNPIGLSLSANLYSLQTASIWGAFGMSFWVLLTNLVFLKAYSQVFNLKTYLIATFTLVFPFVYGYLHIRLNDKEDYTVFNTVLVQPVFPIEECMDFKSTEEFVAFVESEWKEILILSKEHLGKKINLLALPEFIVPFGTYTPIFSYKDVKKTFVEVFGEEYLDKLPPLKEPIAFHNRTNNEWMVTNAYFLQMIANTFETPVIAGMEDAEDYPNGERRYYSSAQYSIPSRDGQIFPLKRYDKRVLVPMGEYIPFSFCRKLAASYGITGSFTPGQSAEIFESNIPFGTSICYEETFGHIMRENKLKGAQVLVNLTSDIWYPTVAEQHCDHAKLRTVENGMPLVRACNTGITSAYDSFGRTVKVLGDNSFDKIWKKGALYATVPIKCYATIYSVLGDYLIVAICSLCISFALVYRK